MSLSPPKKKCTCKLISLLILSPPRSARCSRYEERSLLAKIIRTGRFFFSHLVKQRWSNSLFMCWFEREFYLDLLQETSKRTMEFFFPKVFHTNGPPTTTTQSYKKSVECVAKKKAGGGMSIGGGVRKNFKKKKPHAPSARLLQ